MLAAPLPAEMLAARQFTFLGTGWTYGLANEAALKLREAAGMWTEAYPAMEYRHGPVAVTGEGSIVWLFGTPPDGLGGEIAAAGGTAWFSDEDPLAELVRVQRVAVALARARGLDPDRPRNLARSVILTRAEQAAHVIGVVCLNPALDVTHHVPAVDWSGVNRPDAVHARPGGKGLNVARTLHALGAEVLVMGLAGGTTGEAVTAALAALAVPAAFTWVRGETRRTFTVVDGRTGDAALFNEPGPRIARGRVRGVPGPVRRSVLAGCAAVVLSGSLPPGLPPGSYAELTAMAAGAGVPVLLDAHGEALRLGAAAGPAIVKPNLAELEDVRRAVPVRAGRSGRRGSGAGGVDRRAVAAAARNSGRPGAAAVVVSLGADGLHADTGDGRWHAVPPAVVAGNATGAGDAAAAGLAHGLALGRPWDERLRHAVALGTAAAMAPVAGEFSPADYARLLDATVVTRRYGRRARRGRLMPAAGMSEIVGSARAAGRGVGAFNVIGIEHAEAIVAGAEAAAAPVVLQISENCVAYHGALEPIARACLAIAGSAAVPVAVHLDHATRADLVHAAAGLGLRSVMYDASALPYAQNVQATADMARWCQDRGIWVEAELGEIGGKNGVHSPGARTRPDEAAAYVAATGVDALAVAVGSSHAMLTRDAALDLGLIARDPRRGQRAARAARLVRGPRRRPGRGRPRGNDENQRGDPAEQGLYRRRPRLPEWRRRGWSIPRRYGSAGREAIAAEVARLLHVIGGAGDPVSAVE